jgi:hypothetical protein
MVALLACLALASPLDRAQEALDAFEPERALELLNAATQAGPYEFGDHVRLYEQLGIAHAYLGHEQQALNAFRAMLILDATRSLSYNLSPKVTFVFEKAKKDAGDSPAIQVSWPYDLTTTDDIPVNVEVIANPGGVLATARLFSRTRGANGFDESSLTLDRAHQRVVLPAPETSMVELHLVGLDSRGNEVLHWASPESPREIALSLPTPWYQKWWVWALVGTAAAAGTATGVYFAARGLPDQMSTSVSQR